MVRRLVDKPQDSKGHDPELPDAIPPSLTQGEMWQIGRDTPGQMASYEFFERQRAGEV